MKRSLSLFILAVFFLWLIPLGIFIKPSQEKLVCGGQRAICLCSHMKAGKMSNNAIESGVGLKAGNSAGKEKESSGGASHYFSIALIRADEGLRSSSLFEQPYLRHKDPFLASLEHVPKV